MATAPMGTTAPAYDGMDRVGHPRRVALVMSGVLLVLLLASLDRAYARRLDHRYAGLALDILCQLTNRRGGAGRAQHRHATRAQGVARGAHRYHRRTATGPGHGAAPPCPHLGRPSLSVVLAA